MRAHEPIWLQLWKRPSLNHKVYLGMVVARSATYGFGLFPIAMKSECSARKVGVSRPPLVFSRPYLHETALHMAPILS
jgi:hypothetical protein